MTLVDDEMAVVSHTVIDDALPDEALDDGDVPAGRWIMVVLPLVFGLGLSAGASSCGRSVGSTSSTAASSDDSTRQNTVHVEGYTRKDGTKVAGYDRKVAETKTSGATKNTKSAATSTTPARDSKGRFIRSESAKNAFMEQTGYPKGRPGYVIDHVVPLACGGADAPSNMQWQTVAAASLKDKTERVGCGK